MVITLTVWRVIKDHLVTLYSFLSLSNDGEMGG